MDEFGLKILTGEAARQASRPGYADRCHCYLPLLHHLDVADGKSVSPRPLHKAHDTLPLALCGPGPSASRSLSAQSVGHPHTGHPVVAWLGGCGKLFECCDDQEQSEESCEGKGHRCREEEGMSIKITRCHGTCALGSGQRMRTL